MSSSSNTKEDRQKLIAIAVKFLANPKVEKAADNQKITFLKSKGLTEDEIKEAFKIYKEKKEKKTETETKETNDSASTAKNDTPELTLEELIENAKKSNMLSLRKSNITTIPAAAFNLTNLTTLILSFNKLTNIPNEIKNLQNLEVLHLAGCYLTNANISQELWNLPKLHDLNIAKNKLTDMNSIIQCKTLVKLDASDNEILEIPYTIDQLKNLQFLNLRNNNITVIPASLANIKSLKTFYISGNNIDPKLEKVIKQSGLAGLFEALKDEF